MKAIVYDKKAHPDRLVIKDIVKPVPGENEVLVKIEAVSLNAADYRSMKMGIIPGKKIFGADISGIIESVGKNVIQFKAGDHVTGDIADYGFGGLAEFALAPERLLARKPDNLTFSEATALPMAALTALQALRNKGNIREGDEVLILGSGGGVGTFALQLAKFFNANVTAVCSTRNLEQSVSLGADIVIDYTKEKVTKTGNSYDLIIAVNGNYPLLASKRMLKPGGRYVMAGGTLSQVFKPILFGWMISFGSRKIHFLAAKPDKEDLEFIVNLASEGIIRPVIDKKFPFEETVEAFEYIRHGHARGKVVITLQQE